MYANYPQPAAAGNFGYPQPQAMPMYPQQPPMGYGYPQPQPTYTGQVQPAYQPQQAYYPQQPQYAQPMAAPVQPMMQAQLAINQPNPQQYLQTALQALVSFASTKQNAGTQANQLLLQTCNSPAMNQYPYQGFLMSFALAIHRGVAGGQNMQDAVRVAVPVVWGGMIAYLVKSNQALYNSYPADARQALETMDHAYRQLSEIVKHYMETYLNTLRGGQQSQAFQPINPMQQPQYQQPTQPQMVAPGGYVNPMAPGGVSSQVVPPQQVMTPTGQVMYKNGATPNIFDNGSGYNPGIGNMASSTAVNASGQEVSALGFLQNLYQAEEEKAKLGYPNRPDLSLEQVKEMIAKGGMQQPQPTTPAYQPPPRVEPTPQPHYQQSPTQPVVEAYKPLNPNYNRGTKPLSDPDASIYPTEVHQGQAEPDENHGVYDPNEEFARVMQEVTRTDWTPIESELSKARKAGLPSYPMSCEEPETRYEWDMSVDVADDEGDNVRLEEPEHTLWPDETIAEPEPSVVYPASKYAPGKLPKNDPTRVDIPTPRPVYGDERALYAQIDEAAEKIVEAVFSSTPPKESLLRQLPKAEREEILKNSPKGYKVIPAYVSGHRENVVLSLGKNKHLVQKVIDPMLYKDHETEHSIDECYKRPMNPITGETEGNPFDAEKLLEAATSAKPVDQLVEELEAKLADINEDDIEQAAGEVLEDSAAISVGGVQLVQNPEDYTAVAVAVLQERLADANLSALGMDIGRFVTQYTRFRHNSFHILDGDKANLQSVLRAKNATSIAAKLMMFIEQLSYMPEREVHALMAKATKLVNIQLQVHVEKDLTVDDMINDLDELIDYLTESHGSAAEVNALLGVIYRYAVKEVFNLYDNKGLMTVDAEFDGLIPGLEEADALTIGHLEDITLLPFYYVDYPLAFEGDVTLVNVETNPTLYKLLHKRQEQLAEQNPNIQVRKLTLVTQDNVVFEFYAGMVDEAFVLAR